MAFPKACGEGFAGFEVVSAGLAEVLLLAPSCSWLARGWVPLLRGAGLPGLCPRGCTGDLLVSNDKTLNGTRLSR